MTSAGALDNKPTAPPTAGTYSFIASGSSISRARTPSLYCQRSASCRALPVFFFLFQEKGYGGIGDLFIAGRSSRSSLHLA